MKFDKYEVFSPNLQVLLDALESCHTLDDISVVRMFSRNLMVCLSLMTTTLTSQPLTRDCQNTLRGRKMRKCRDNKK